MPTAWSAEVLTVEALDVQCGEQQLHLVREGTPLWHVVQGMGEQVLLALDELGFVRTDALGHTHGFKVKELAVTPDGTRAVIHLDVTDSQLFQPAAPGAQRGKPVSYASLVSTSVVEQMRVRLSEMLGGQVEVWADNHYWVRYIADLRSLWRTATEVFPTHELGDVIAAVPGPFHIPLGYDSQGTLRFHDLRRGQHLLLTGITGGGKSTWLDTVITTLARTTAPSDLKLVFLDPQRLNFSPYAHLTAHHFTDADGPLGVVWRPEELVQAMVRLNHEHLRRVERIGATPWGSIEDYNQHATPQARLPYIAVFTEELAVLRDTLATQLNRQQVRAFDGALNSLVVGARKVGVRLCLCLQYLKNAYLPRETASQAGLILAFHNTPQGSKNTLGDTAAALLRQAGRFIIEGLPEGRRVLQGVYVDRAQVLDLLQAPTTPQTFPVDGLVLELLTFILEHQEGKLSRAPLHEAFQHVMSIRQLRNFIRGLEEVGLVLPGEHHTVPKQPRRLACATLEQAVAVLQYHPEICFHEEQDAQGARYVFGPARQQAGK